MSNQKIKVGKTIVTFKYVFSAYDIKPDEQTSYRFFMSREEK